MKKLFYLSFSLILLSNIIFCTTYSIGPVTTKTPYKQTVGSTITYNFSYYENRVGDEVAGNYCYLFRTVSQFNPVTLPSGAFDAKVYLDVSGSQFIGSSFNVLQLPDNYQFPDSAQDVYNSISGSILLSVTTAGMKSHDITSLALSGKTLTFGAVATNQNGLTFTGFTIRVVYHMPITIKNDFEFGTINCAVDVPATDNNSPASLNARAGQTVNMQAVEQTYNSIKRRWLTGSRWIKTPYQGAPSDLTTSSSYSFTMTESDERATFTAKYTKVYSVTCQNRNYNQDIGGVVSYGGSNVPVTQSFDAPENSPISLTAVSQEIGYMSYTFSYWDDNSTNPTITWTAGGNTVRTAYFKGTPLFPDGTIRHLSVTQSLNNFNRLTWSEHPNSLVTCYRIYRKAQNTPSWTNPQLLATVPRGTTSFEDPDYIFTRNYETILLYDVRAVNTYDNIESGAAFQGPYYGELIKGSDHFNTADAVILENSLDNYPNPFNPLTQIKYSLKENSFVTLQVYDILGNKVAELVNEYKPAGNYSVSFDASDKPSGIYICTIKANNYTSTKKMLLVK